MYILEIGEACNAFTVWRARIGALRHPVFSTIVLLLGVIINTPTTALSALDQPEAVRRNYVRASSCQVRFECPVLRTLHSNSDSVLHDGDKGHALGAANAARAYRDGLLAVCETADDCARIVASNNDAVDKRPDGQELNADFVQLLKNWQNCFTRQVTAENVAMIISACDRAAVFPDLGSRERQRLASRRTKLLDFIGQSQELKSTGSGELRSEGKR
jgi:hypothetical protein